MSTTIEYTLYSVQGLKRGVWHPLTSDKDLAYIQSLVPHWKRFGCTDFKYTKSDFTETLTRVDIDGNEIKEVEDGRNTSSVE